MLDSAHHHQPTANLSLSVRAYSFSLLCCWLETRWRSVRRRSEEEGAIDASILPMSIVASTGSALLGPSVLDDTGQQGRVVVIQDDSRRSCVQQMGCGGCSGRSGSLRNLLDHAARSGRMRRLAARLRDLMLEHAMWLATSSRLILPEARRGRTGLLDFHVTHRTRTVVALALLPKLAGFLVTECRWFMAVLAVRSFLTCRIIEEVAVMQISWQVHKWLLLHRCLPGKTSPSRSESNFC